MSELKISDYGMIGNTRTAALISREGSLDWCCFPRFDSPGFFSRILDEDGGHFQISPFNAFQSHQSYLEDTNVLETIFETKNGKVRLLDCFTVETEEEKRKHLTPAHEILRVVECLEGEVDMNWEFHPRPGFGKRKFRMRLSCRFGLSCEFGQEAVALFHDCGPGNIFTMKKGDKKIFSLVYSDIAPGIFPTIGEHALMRLEKTIQWWRDWTNRCTYQGPYARDVRRSILALKLLSFSPSGAIVAAPTTSLPEEIHGKRNWDYRYCWLRDASFTIRSFLGLGFIEEASAYMSWILHSTALTRPRLQVLYTVYGEAKIPEKELPWFSGFKNSKPVRVGNAAAEQFQLDVYGEVMDAVCVYAPFMNRFDKDTIKFLTGIADSVCELWENPDEGIWEVRSGKSHHTHSMAMAAHTLDLFLNLAKEHGWKIDEEKYQRTCGLIKREIEMYGFNLSLNAYTGRFLGEELDGALLTLPILHPGLNPERVKETIAQIRDKLNKSGLIYRYRYLDDGVEGGEGAFAACSFWLVESLARIGKSKDAEDLMKELLARENETGLWSEEIDPDTNEYLGNYPQAFTHTALISAALSLKENLS